jgi:hypothetical protein
VTVEDRTAPCGQGSAFKTIDGTGIEVVDSPRMLLTGNRVIIANNIIADFGYGQAAWNWKDSGNRAAIFLACETNTPLTDAVVKGNIVYDPGRDGVLVDGKPQIVPPRYT